MSYKEKTQSAVGKPVERLCNQTSRLHAHNVGSNSHSSISFQDV